MSTIIYFRHSHQDVSIDSEAWCREVGFFLPEIIY